MQPSASNTESPTMAEPLATLRDRAVFEQALKTKPLARSEHFVLHHCSHAPVVVDGAAAKRPAGRPDDGSTGMLSTISGQDRQEVVDNLITTRPEVSPKRLALCLGLVVPKRHAKRAVTRNTIKRQARALGSMHGAALGEGAYVLRLKAPFAPPTYRAATSDALRAAVRHEIDTMFVAATTAVAARAVVVRRAP